VRNKKSGCWCFFLFFIFKASQLVLANGLRGEGFRSMYVHGRTKHEVWVDNGLKASGLEVAVATPKKRKVRG